MISTNLIELMFKATNISRWNDYPRMIELSELDKQAHKLIIAYFLAKLERDVDMDFIIRGGIFEFLARVQITDIRPDIFHKITQTKRTELTAWVVERLRGDLPPELLAEFCEYYADDGAAFGFGGGAGWLDTGGFGGDFGGADFGADGGYYNDCGAQNRQTNADLFAGRGSDDKCGANATPNSNLSKSCGKNAGSASSQTAQSGASSQTAQGGAGWEYGANMNGGANTNMDGGANLTRTAATNTAQNFTQTAAENFTQNAAQSCAQNAAQTATIQNPTHATQNRPHDNAAQNNHRDNAAQNFCSAAPNSNLSHHNAAISQSPDNATPNSNLPRAAAPAQNFATTTAPRHRNPHAKERLILRAAGYLATRWEFGIIHATSEFIGEIEQMHASIEAEFEDYIELVGVQKIARNHRLARLVDMAGRLRFQRRWALTRRLPETSVLGHMLIVAVLSFFYSLAVGACKKRLENNFFCALFHDLPEALTRDIISPVKHGVSGLDEVIAEFEMRLIDEQILPNLPREMQGEFAYILGVRTEFDERNFPRQRLKNEFENRIWRRAGSAAGDFSGASGAGRNCAGGSWGATFGANSGENYSAGNGGNYATRGAPASASGAMSLYNADNDNAIDGRAIKQCDKLAAFAEAGISIACGVKSKELLDGYEGMFAAAARQPVCEGVDFGALYTALDEHFFKEESSDFWKNRLS